MSDNYLTWEALQWIVFSYYFGAVMRHWFKKMFRRRRIFRNHANSPESRIPKGTYCNSLVIKNAETGDKCKYIPIGVFPLHPDGPHEITVDKLNEMLSNQSGDIMIDLGHESLWSPGAPAYGWITMDSLEVREDGLYGDYPQFTPDAEEMVANRKYRYLSPAYQIEAMDKQGRDIGARLWRVALTNTPYFDQEIDALRNSRASDKKKESTMEITTEIKKKLGLEKDATDEQVQAKLDEIVKIAEGIANTPEIQTLELTEASEEPEISGKMETVLNSILARLDKIDSSRETEREESFRARSELLVNSAIDNRQIAPAERDIYFNSAMAEYDKTKARIDAIPRGSLKPGRIALPGPESPEGAAVKSNSQLKSKFSAYIRSQRIGIA
jgi:hypothetical protein